MALKYGDFAINPIDKLVLKLHFEIAEALNYLFGISNFKLARIFNLVSLTATLVTISITLVALIMGYNLKRLGMDSVTFGSAIGIGIICLDAIAFMDDAERKISTMLHTQAVSIEVVSILKKLGYITLGLLGLSILDISVMAIEGITLGDTLMVIFFMTKMSSYNFIRCINLPGRKSALRIAAESIQKLFRFKPRLLPNSL